MGETATCRAETQQAQIRHLPLVECGLQALDDGFALFYLEGVEMKNVRDYLDMGISEFASKVKEEIDIKSRRDAEEVVLLEKFGLPAWLDIDGEEIEDCDYVSMGLFVFGCKRVMPGEMLRRSFVSTGCAEKASIGFSLRMGKYNAHILFSSCAKEGGKHGKIFLSVRKLSNTGKPILLPLEKLSFPYCIIS